VLDELVSEMYDDVFGELSADIESEPPTEALLLPKVKNAIREVKLHRRYPKFYSDEMIFEDLSDFYSLIRQIVVYDYNQIGSEGESSHSEKNISRTYRDRERLFYGITPIANLPSKKIVRDIPDINVPIEDVAEDNGQDGGGADQTTGE